MVHTMEYKMYLFANIGTWIVMKNKAVQKIFGDGPYQQARKKIPAKNKDA